MTATDPSTHERRDPRVAGQLAGDLQERGLDLAQLQARINAVSDTESVFPLTDEHLQEIESIRTAISEVQDAVTRARTRAVQRAVTLRWTYERVGKATGLSKGRIGQIAPRRPRA
jgi:NADH dehydrogenase/NADH:ubiquinone oxidoreductase subunit G